MDIRSCKTCGKIFQASGNSGPDCPSCVRERDMKFIRVRDYMFEKPQASIDDICRVCDIDEEYVLRWLREGRLVASKDAALLRCEECNVPITRGKYCKRCESAVQERFSSAAADIAKSMNAHGNIKR